MHRQQFAVGLLALAGVALASACGDSDPVSAPRTPLPLNQLVTSGSSVPTAAVPTALVSAVAENMCADVWGVSRDAGAQVVAWPCHGGANQQWTLQPSGEITIYDGAMCLDAWTGQGNDGDKLVIWPCHGGANQKWTRTAAGEVVGVNGKCLDVLGANREPGTKLVIWSCHGGANQKWTVGNAAAAAAEEVPAPVSASAPEVPSPAGSVQGVASASAGAAELPRTYLDTRMPAPTGRTISVAAGGNIQAALDAAQPGDVVALAAGATYVGNFRLPVKSGMGAGQWITVRTAGTLPAEGTRVGPADAGQMPKLVTPNNEPALAAAAGAQGWRLAGIEVTTLPSAPPNYGILVFGSGGENTLAQVPSRLVLDRSYVHGQPSVDSRRCIVLNSAASAVVDSYVSECHSNNGDSQAILGWNGPGPFKIVNNRLEGGHEVIMFGGADPALSGAVPSDIEIRRNHVTRPTSWRGVWRVKNLLELKMGQRLLVEGNVFENNWADAQTGFAFVWSTNNQDGGCTWCVTQDVTFRYNRVSNTAGGFNLAANGTGTQGRINPGAPMRRVTIAHNVITGLDASNGRLLQISGAVAELSFTRNTGLGVTHNLLFATPDQPLPTFVYRDNISGGEYVFFADGRAMGPGALTALHVPAANVAGNVIYSSQSAWAVPPGNTSVPSPQAVGFADLAGGNLTLGPGSSYLTSGVGGARPGADMAAVTQYTQGVVR